MKSYQFPTKNNIYDKNSFDSSASIQMRSNRNLHRSSRFFTGLMQILTPILVLLIVGFSIYFAVFKLGLFYISDVQVIGAKNFVSATDILELTKSRTYGKNFFALSTEELRTSLTKDFQGAKSINVTKNLPNKVSIKVEERTPIALVSNSKSPDFYMVDMEGYVLGIVDPTKTNLPQVIYDGDISVGYFLNKDSLAIYFQVLNAADIEKIKSSSMSLHSDYLSMYVEDSIEILIGTDKDISKTMKVISQLITQLKTEGKNLKKIDLRFDKVIVSYR